MINEIPRGKWQRSYTTGKTAVKISRKVLKYLVKKPFLSSDKKEQAKEDLDRDSAEILFSGLSLLKGTALKAAQMLSLELDIFPAQIRRELGKSYHQVPPINRALVRKIVQNSLKQPPEKIFDSFDTQAFAAASLGQVHHAVSLGGEKLAVKIQYPDIANTITSDIRLVKAAVRPLAEYELICIALKEIEEILLLETDYEKEAANLEFFAKHLQMENVKIPEVDYRISGKTILSQTHFQGPTLNAWLQTNPDQSRIDAVAQILHDIFLKGFYELNCIHADPNPGNFIILNDCEIGLIDFGCVKRFDSKFVNLYKQLACISTNDEESLPLSLLRELEVFYPDMDTKVEHELHKYMVAFSKWFGKPYQKGVFDFKENSDYILEGKEILKGVQKYRKHINSINTNFIFLDRTRYGLFRLFERMGAKIRIRNKYETKS